MPTSEPTISLTKIPAKLCLDRQGTENTPLTLEQAISFLREDELLEVTPRSLRMRKMVLSSRKRHTLQWALRKEEVRAA